MKVALMTEGTYPHQFGGVSVWCDQLVRGMPEHQFHVTALVATGAEQQAWQLPDNVVSVVTVPLWGTERPGRKPGRLGLRHFLFLLEEFVDTLTGHPAGAVDRFGAVLLAMFEYAQREN